VDLLDTAIRYTTGDNTLLRFALFEAWKYRCYWCSRPVDFTIIEIDHIIPKETGKEDLNTVIAAYGRDADYDLHMPYNLAPICRPCNGSGTKGAMLPTGAGLVMSRLQKAANLSTEVSTKVERMQRAKIATKHFVLLAEMSLANEESRALFIEYGPILVQKLANLQSSALQYETSLGVRVDPDQGMPYVDVFLDDRGRTTAALIEELSGVSLADVAKGAARKLLTEIHLLVNEALEQEILQSGDGFCRGANYGIWLEFPQQIVMDGFDFHRGSGGLDFVFSGSYFSDYKANFSSAREGISTVGHAGVSISTRWSMPGCWKTEYPQAVETGEIALEETQIQAWSSYEPISPDALDG
jgi:5-methylcytosine-specific restriction endonuclease McrA